MPRIARKQSATDILHVMIRGINREDIFRETDDYKRFLAVLRQCKSICGFELFAWCLMGNHVHLLIRAGQEPIAMVMKRIGCRYVYWFNKKYNRIGHLFQDRYRSEAVETDAYFLTALRYILQNPLKAGLEQRMGQYPFTSFSAYAGQPDGLTDISFAADYFENRDSMMVYLTSPTRETAMDVGQQKIAPSDAEVLKWAQRAARNSKDACFKTLSKDKQQACVKEIHMRGATIRQIAEATDMAKSVIGRMLKD